MSSPPSRSRSRTTRPRPVPPPRRAPGVRGSAWRATMPSSMAGVAPSPLTSSATRSPAAKRPSATISSRSASTTASDGASATRRTPRSPWMPRPSSISPSSSVNPGAPAAGTMQGESATPIVATASAAHCAASRTCARLSPAAEAAPATLWTSTVPARPRRPVAAVLSRSATSSATTTISAAIPSPRAISAARPKFSRSPV